MTASSLLDALTAGDLDRDLFLSELNVLVKADPEEGWELLSAVDQYYRRGKIQADLYHVVNSHLSGLLLGAKGGSGGSVPMPAAHEQLRATGFTVPVRSSAPRLEPIPTAGATTPAAAASKAVESVAHVRPDRAQRVIVAGDILRDRYRLVRIIGHGGSGTVFEAIDQYRIGLPDSDQRVALKVLHAAVTRNPELLSSLQREFQHLQLLSHPNIVRVHEFDRDGETAFFTMEFLGGASLQRVLGARNGVPMDRPHARAIIGDIGAALAHAHARGIVHGDVNPHNVFITDEGEVRILDFGSSNKITTGPWIAEWASPRQPRFATLGFASCELLEGQPATVRDDLFGLACVAYVLLAGKHPFGGRTAIEARTAGMRPRRPAGLPRRQWHALREGLRLDHRHRPADVEKWVHRLHWGAPVDRLPILATLMTAPQPRRRAAIAAMVGAALILIVSGALWIPQDHDLRFRAAALAVRMRDVALKYAGSLHHAVERRASMPAPNAIDSSRPPASTADAPESHAAIAPAPATASATASKARRGALPYVDARRASAAPPARARIELAANFVQVSPTEPFARVMVRRSGSRRGAVSFTWRTESGTAVAGKDFVAVNARVERIAAGKSEVMLYIPIFSYSARREPKNFYVVIGDPGPGAVLGGRFIVMITIPAAE